MAYVKNEDLINFTYSISFSAICYIFHKGKVKSDKFKKYHKKILTLHVQNAI